MSVRIGAGLALAALAAAPAGAQSEQRTLRGESVAIYNLAGRVRASAGSGDAVTVEITRGGRDGDKLRIESGALGGRETLRVLYPADRIVYGGMRGRSRATLHVRPDGTFGDGNWSEWGRDRVEVREYGSGLEAHADLLVRVPKGQRIALYLAVGVVEIANVEGDVLVDVNAAEVDVAGVRGNLSLDTGSGRVTVRDVAGDVNLDSGSGGLSVERVKGSVLNIEAGSGGISGSDIEVRELRADVGSGGLRLYRARAPQVDLEAGSGGVHVELIAPVERLDAETGSGGVSIRLPANAGAEIEVETGSGGFETDFDIVTRRLSRNHVVGRIGDGRGRIRLEAGSGRIQLLKTTAVPAER